MSHLRYDLIQKRWIIYAPEREKRPSDYARPQAPVIDEPCPFCPGNEHLTPPTKYAYPHDHSWQIRIFDNKYSALTTEPGNHPKYDGYITSPGTGIHEVIVEHPQHDIDFPQMPTDHIFNLLCVYRRRMKDLLNEKDLKHTLIFRNFGYFAGATKAHAHSQLVSMHIIPRTVQMELESAAEFYRKTDICLFCSELEKELKYGERIIYYDNKIAVYAPFASRTAFELMIVPAEHSAAFNDASDENLKSLAIGLKDVVTRLKRLFPELNYNLILHSAPHLTSNLESNSFHWHFELLPRIGYKAGYEIGSGFYINSVLPEDAVSQLGKLSDNTQGDTANS